MTRTERETFKEQIQSRLHMAIDFRRDPLPAPRSPGDQDYEREVQAAADERSRALAAAVDHVDRANATIAYQARVERAWQVQRRVLRAVRENEAGGHTSFGQRQEVPALPTGWPSTIPGRL